MMQQRQAQHVYKQNQIMTANPKKLIVLLYDGCIKNMKQAELAIHEQQIEQANHALKKAQDIILELQSTLNFEAGGDIAQNLNDIYIYLMDKLIESNIKKDAELVLQSRKLLEDLREAWTEIS
ncbi:flagellar export chaperone FliS [Pisciglobus halotolerans]|uniref:Flagellar protein FliS n=1 Tax=Pisciglobus halotolerans TaxID=745365 RepID=A0A1I3ANB1_9LACT|nr:flagellar export chaperone FliS [Pisciglobus halotolerans]SFH51544.1 flagellar protein FliS [Pisciglobus halotolerans]